jgi:hypothetical protein
MEMEMEMEMEMDRVLGKLVSLLCLRGHEDLPRLVALVVVGVEDGYEDVR